MAVRIDNETTRRRAITAWAHYVTPVVRWATMLGATAIALFGSPADAPWALGALGVAVVSSPQ